MNILVTGATGFVGCHLLRALRNRGEAKLLAVNRSTSWPNTANDIQADVELVCCDLTSTSELEALLRKFDPQQIYHLAGYAAAGRSFKEPHAAWQGNFEATRSLYDAVHAWGGKPRILFVGTGMVYGNAGETHAMLDEDTPLLPSSPYAVSKAAADLHSYQQTCEPGMDIVRARPFNHIGPGQSPEYAIPAFARQVVAIKQGRQSPRIETGNLFPQRDLTDVRDMVAAYISLMAKGKTGQAYNIAKGESYSMQEVLDRLIALADLDVEVEVRQRADLVRTTELTVPRVDTTRLRETTGWQPRITLDETLRDILASGE